MLPELGVWLPPASAWVAVAVLTLPLTAISPPANRLVTEMLPPLTAVVVVPSPLIVPPVAVVIDVILMLPLPLFWIKIPPVPVVAATPVKPVVKIGLLNEPIPLPALICRLLAAPITSVPPF